jgi:hypothetical protein
LNFIRFTLIIELRSVTMMQAAQQRGPISTRFVPARDHGEGMASVDLPATTGRVTYLAAVGSILGILDVATFGPLALRFWRRPR